MQLPEAFRSLPRPLETQAKPSPEWLKNFTTYSVSFNQTYQHYTL